MYENLRLELARKNITQEAVAKLIGCTEKTLRNKLNGTTDFTVSEAMLINDNILPEFGFGYLFSRSA